MSPYGGASAFLLQTWDEFFDPFTPDSYQPRLHHTASLVAELEDVAGRATKDERWVTHIALIKAELKHVANAEASFLSAMTRYQWTVSELLKLDNPREIVCLARTIRAERTNYDLHASAVLRSNAAELPKGKEDARFALHRIATNFVQSGRTAGQALALITDANLAISPQEVAEKLLSTLSDSVSDYCCVLILRGEASAIQHIARKVGFSLLRPERLHATAGVESFLASASGAILVEKSTRAPFPAEAANNVAQELRHAIDLYNFYQHGSVLDLLQTALVLDSASNQATIVSPGAPALRRLKPRKNTVELTHSTIEGIEAHRLTGHLRNALEHCSLAHSGTAQKIQLVNLWSATECLAASSRVGSVLGRVVEVVAPIVVWRRIEKLLRYVAIALHDFQRKGATTSLGGGFPPGKQFVSPGWLMLTLTKPAQDPDLVALFKFASSHPLLCNRVKTLWESLKDPKKLARELARSKQRVEWQLARIYRARNLIAHDGEEAPYLHVLLDHLHFYFSMALSRILHGLRVNAIWRPEDSITHWRARSDYVIDGLKNFPARLQVSDFFTEAQEAGDHHPWP